MLLAVNRLFCKSAYRVPNDRLLGVIPGFACPKTLHFQADKCPKRKQDVVLLRHRRTRLTFLHRATLLERAVIVLDRKACRANSWRSASVIDRSSVAQ